MLAWKRMLDDQQRASFLRSPLAIPSEDVADGAVGKRDLRGILLQQP
jgi:hypothetical protein